MNLYDRYDSGGLLSLSNPCGRVHGVVSDWRRVASWPWPMHDRATMLCTPCFSRPSRTSPHQWRSALAASALTRGEAGGGAAGKACMVRVSTVQRDP